MIQVRISGFFLTASLCELENSFDCGTKYYPQASSASVLGGLEPLSLAVPDSRGALATAGL